MVIYIKFFSGRSQLHLGDTEASQTGHIQVTSLQNPLCLQHRHARHLHRLQRVDADHVWHDRQHGTPADVQYADLQLQRQRHLQR